MSVPPNSRRTRRRCPRRVWLLSLAALVGGATAPAPAPEEVTPPYSTINELPAGIPSSRFALAGEPSPAIAASPPSVATKVALPPAPSTSPPVMDPVLSLEDRRYLLYLYARLNQPKMAEPLAQRILADNPGDKQTLLVLASMYIERKDTEKALNTARTLVKFYPQDHQALYFLAAAYYQARQYETANKIFRNLKLEQFPHQLYPYETDLAAAALKAGDWHRAMLAYQELLRHHSLSEELRWEARKVLEGIYYEHLPSLNWQATGVWLRQGLAYRTGAEYRRHLTDSQRVWVRYGRDDVRVNPAPEVRGGWSNWDEARLGLETTFSRRWRTELWAGGSGAGLLGGASVTRTFGEQRDLKLAFFGQEAAYEGLLFEALNGRENRVELAGNYLLERNWLSYGRVYVRQLVLGGESLGQGYGANWNVEHVFTHPWPDFRVGYRLSYASFQRQGQNVGLVERAAPLGATPDQKLVLLEGLTLAELHREGVYFVWRNRLSGGLYYNFGAGADYALEQSGLVYDALAGLSYFPRKSLELRAESAYSSSARTSNLDSDQWQISIALRYWF